MRNPDQEFEKPKAESIEKFTSEKVLLLTDKTFESTLQKAKSALVVFFTDWCGHCKALKPIYSKAADLAYEQGILGALAAVDCGAHYPICKQHNIEGYPTIKHFKNGKFFRDYTKERTTDAIIQFLKFNDEKDEL